MSENWAVCIGINSYDSLKPLDCAWQDAEAVNDFFKDTLHFKNVYFLAEDAPPLKADFLGRRCIHGRHSAILCGSCGCASNNRFCSRAIISGSSSRVMAGASATRTIS